MRNGRNPINFSFILSASAVVLFFAAANYYLFLKKEADILRKKKRDSSESTSPEAPSTTPPAQLASKFPEFDDYALLLEEHGDAKTRLEEVVLVEREKTPIKSDDANEDDQTIAGRFNPAAPSQEEIDPEWVEAPSSKDRFYADAQSTVAAAQAQSFFSVLASYNPFAATPAPQPAACATTQNSPTIKN